MATIREVVRDRLRAYCKASRKEKGEILDTLETVLPISRRAIISRLSRMRRRDPWKHPPRKRGAKTKYGPGVTAALQTVWEASGEICGELLHPIIAEYVAVLRRDGLWTHRDGETKLLLAMSEGTVKKRLSGFRKARRGRGRSSTSPSQLKEIIPVFTGPWEGKPAGYGQMDTVVHCGTSLAGDMVYTLQFVDTKTYWAVQRAQWNKGEKATKESLSVLREMLPFPMRGAHSDSGGEFVNHCLKDFCREHEIEQTRSRPYRKNDGAFVEERNGHIVRKHFGYGRIDARAAVSLMNEYYDILSLYANHFVPTRRCVEKKRIGSRYVRRYEKAETPYARVVRDPDVTPSTKRKLKKQHGMLNPLLLKRELDTLRTRIFTLQKAKGNRK